jgi:aryl-alcohol dehydrogenase-like predicted oxidoreductase
MKLPSLSFHDTVERFLYQSPRGPLRYGIGCAWLGRDPDLKDLPVGVATLENAYAAGFRYFDTSSAYAQSEVVLGRWLVGIPRGSIFLATKSHLPTHPTPREAYEHIQRSLDASLKRLNTPAIDLFQIHDIQDLAGVFEPGGALQALLEARQQGLIGFIGMATRAHTLLRAAARSGQFHTILTYGDYCLKNQSAAGLIEEARALNVGVINASPLLGLSFYGKDTPGEGQLLADALRFPLSNPHITLTLTGPANPEQLSSSVRALAEE